jgi:hypothetical protein
LYICSFSFLYGSPSTHILYFIFTLHLQTGYQPVPLFNYSLFWSHPCISLLASLFLHYTGKLAPRFLMPRWLSLLFTSFFLPRSLSFASVSLFWCYSSVSIPLTGYCAVLHKQSPHTLSPIQPHFHLFTAFFFELLDSCQRDQ